MSDIHVEIASSYHVDVEIVDPAPAEHNLLSARHTDTVSGSPVVGDIPYGNATPKWTKLPGNTTTTKKFLRSTGTGAAPTIPAWDTLVRGDIPSDAQVPAGVIVAWVPGYFGDGSNGSYTAVLALNTIAAANAYLNPLGWYVCNGAALNLAASSIFNGATRYLPNLTDDRFIMGDTTVGVLGGSSSSAHTHSIGSYAAADESSHTHAGGSLAAANAGGHSHSTASVATGNESANHTHGVSGNTGGGTNHHHSTVTMGTDDTADESAHTHGVTITSGGISGNHTHNFDSPNVAIADHSHSLSGTSGTGSTHGHALSGTSGAASASENRPLFLGALYIMRVL